MLKVVKFLLCLLCWLIGGTWAIWRGSEMSKNWDLVAADVDGG